MSTQPNVDNPKLGYQGEQDLNSSRLAILDFLFTFALATGLLPEAFLSNSTGIYSEVWLREVTLPSLEELTRSLTLLFGIITLTFSWYGYHEAIRRKPHTIGSWQGFARFQIDAILILIYCAMILSMESLNRSLLLAVVVYSLYFCWDLLQGQEYPETTVANAPGMYWRWPIYFLVLFVVAHNELLPTLLLALISIVLSVWYRLLKLRSIS